MLKRLLKNIAANIIKSLPNKGLQMEYKYG